MSFVYWITDDLNADISSHGYVGITSKTVDVRIRTHKKSYNSFCNGSDKQGCLKLYRAIKNRGGWNNVFIKTICESTTEYCLELERKLRNTADIGWNIRVGGDTPLMLGRKLSDEAKKKLSDVRQTWIMSDSSKLKLSNDRMGESNPMHGVLPWENPSSNDISKYSWKFADDIYSAWIIKTKSGVKSISKLFPDLNYWTIDTIVRRFKTGWNPLKDADWIKYKENTSAENH